MSDWSDYPNIPVSYDHCSTEYYKDMKLYEEKQREEGKRGEENSKER
jgi:hypothetical protein